MLGLGVVALAAARCEQGRYSAAGVCASVGGADVIWDAAKRRVLAAVEQGPAGSHRDLTLNAGRPSHGRPEAREAIADEGFDVWPRRGYADFRLPADAWHREFVLGGHPAASAELYLKTSEMCGADLFSQPDLTCTLLDQASVRSAHRLAAGFDVPRAFGVELELVGKRPSRAAADELAYSWLRSEQDHAEPGTAGHLLRRQVLRPSAARRAAIAVPHRNRTAIERPWAHPVPEWIRSRVSDIPGLAFCVDAAAQGSDRERAARWPNAARGEEVPCRADSDCSLAEFCTTRRACRPRQECGEDARPLEGACPLLVASWRWETDCTVRALTSSQVRAVLPGADRAARREHETGTGFELVSALPPHAPSGHQGLRNVAEVLTLLRHAGVQAGPSSGLHVHVNVGRPGGVNAHADQAGAGEALTTAQIANVWTQYAKFQYVIDEMLQDSRIGNEWAQGLRFHDYRVLVGSPAEDGAGAVETPTTANDAAAVFARLFAWVNTHRRSHSESEFCDWASGGYLRGVAGDEWDTVCDNRYPIERYMQVNLVVLNKYGTLEFRAFPATTSAERAVKWVKFVVSFVEAFKDRGEFLADMRAAGAEAALAALERAQARATLAQLATELGMGEDDARFWREKPWMAGNPACGHPASEGAARTEAREQALSPRASMEALHTEPKLTLDRSSMRMVALEEAPRSPRIRLARNPALVRSAAKRSAQRRAAKGEDSERTPCDIACVIS